MLLLLLLRSRRIILLLLLVLVPVLLLLLLLLSSRMGRTAYHRRDAVASSRHGTGRLRRWGRSKRSGLRLKFGGLEVRCHLCAFDIQVLTALEVVDMASFERSVDCSEATNRNTKIDADPVAAAAAHGGLVGFIEGDKLEGIVAV